MKLLFIDEFKENKKDFEFYGLSAILVDNSSYLRFKNGFYKKLKELGWDKEIEIKGRHSFSNTTGDTKVSVEERLKFVENLFELSKSGNEKYASAKVYYTLDGFPKKKAENEMYYDLFERILKKISKGSKDGNKNGKNNIAIFIDNNSSLDINFLTKIAEEKLKERELFLIERCISLSSGNDTPGIIFADHVAYFIHNYIKSGDFNDKSKERVKVLLSNLSNGTITSKDQEELNLYVNSFKKEKKSFDLLRSLKTMVYVK